MSETSLPHPGRGSGAARASALVVALLLPFATGQAPRAQASTDGAQGTPAPQRPRIGLVLSGGGARGTSHIGVLKVLEEMHVPIDAIAGSSMGAVVGGLYASGLSPAEIERVMTSIDWQQSFRDRPSREDLAFRRKQDDQDFPVKLPLGLKGGKFLLPKGLIQGQKLNQMLRTLTIPVSDIDDFDKLPIPFRAVAADIATGEAVVLSHGDLPTAMRASMSAPGVFSPVEVAGRLLVDGGIAENLPVQIARSMGVDVLIVVDVSYPLQPREKLSSALEISNQMLAILIRRETERQRATLGPRDVFISAALPGITSLSFAAVTQSIAGGEAAAREAEPQLRALSVSPGEFAQYQVARAAPEHVAPQIDFVRADQGSGRYARTIEATLEPFVGKPLDVDKLDQRITELYGLDTFETLDYHVVRDGDQRGLEVQARRKSWGPNYVRFGLKLQDDFEGNNSFDASARFIVTEVNSLGAEWITDLQVGENPQFRTEFFQPLTSASRWFVAPQIDLQVRSLQIIDQQQAIAEYRVRSAEASLALGREFGNWGEARVGVSRGSGESRVHVGDPNLPENSFQTGDFFARFSYDELNNLAFPRHGELFTAQWDAARTGLGDDVSSDKVTFDWLVARSVGRHTFIMWLSAGSTLDADTASVEDLYTLGGFLNLSGLAPNSISGPQMGIGRLIYFRQIGRGGPGFLNVPAYIGVSLEAGNVWGRRGDVSWNSALKDGSLYLGLDTFLGPLYLAVGADSEGDTAFYLFMGRPF